MSPKEYERYVEELLRHLEFGPAAVIRRDDSIPGVRQPGEYQIDISVRSKVAGKIDFLLIVECKNWIRPVDRPVVQKIVQTRDAVAAHKAAVVSPVGFTQGAVDTAAANGVALWVVSRTQWMVVMGAVGPPAEAWRRHEERSRFLARLGFSKADETELALIEIDGATRTDHPDWSQCFTHSSTRGSAVTGSDGLPGFDRRLATSQIADLCGELAGLEVPPAL